MCVCVCVYPLLHMHTQEKIQVVKLQMQLILYFHLNDKHKHRKHYLLLLLLLAVVVFHSIQVFHTSSNWWFFTVFWVIASLLRFPGLFSVFQPTLIRLWSVWSWLFCFPIPPVSFPTLYKLFQVHQRQLVSLSPSFSIAFVTSLEGSKYFTPGEFFILALIVFSLKSKWHQVSLGLQNSSKYPDCCGQDGFNSSSNLQFIKSLFQVLMDCFKGSDYDWYHSYYHVPRFFLLSSKVEVSF